MRLFARPCESYVFHLGSLIRPGNRSAARACDGHRRSQADFTVLIRDFVRVADDTPGADPRFPEQDFGLLWLSCRSRKLANKRVGFARACVEPN